jgi:integrase
LTKNNTTATNNKLATYITTTNQEAYHNLIDTCKTAPTRYLYLKSVRYFLRYQGLDEENDFDKLLTQDPKIIQANLAQFIVFLRDDKKSSSSTIKSYVAGLKHFYDMNEITTLNWRKINRHQPEHEACVEDRPYTREEIQRLLEAASPRDRAIILLMASSGLRVGAVSALTIKSLKPIDKYDIYKIMVYRKSKSQYFSFCTPETRKEIDAYLERRNRVGERLKPESPLFRKEFDTQDIIQANNPRPLSTGAIRWNIVRLLEKSGVRIPQKLTEQNILPKRTELMACHALRKRLDTEAMKAGMNPLYIEIIEGHASGLKHKYFKPCELDLLEGNDKMLGYISVIDALTINDEHRLRRESKTLKSELSRLDSLVSDLAEIKGRLGIQ